MSLAHTLPHTEKRLSGNNGHESAGDLILLEQEGWFCYWNFSLHTRSFFGQQIPGAGGIVIECSFPLRRYTVTQQRQSLAGYPCPLALLWGYSMSYAGNTGCSHFGKSEYFSITEIKSAYVSLIFRLKNWRKTQSLLIPAWSFLKWFKLDIKPKSVQYPA